MKIVESRKIRVAATTRSSVKQAAFVDKEPVDLPAVQFQDAPRVGNHTGCRSPAAAFSKVSLERFAENLAHLLPLSNRFQLGAAEEVLVEQCTDLTTGHDHDSILKTRYHQAYRTMYCFTPARSRHIGRAVGALSCPSRRREACRPKP